MPVFCSVISSMFLAHARVLASSIREHHPSAQVVVLIVDGSDSLSYKEEFEVVTPADIGVAISELHEMAAIYEPAELCKALVPVLCLYLLRETHDPALFMDADTLALSAFEGLDELARTHGLVLTPHYLRPVPYRALLSRFERTSPVLRYQDDRALLRYGQMNSGFVAVTSEAEPFLHWWSGWLKHHCLRDVDAALYGEQKWLDCVPIFFPYALLREPGYNVAVWNLHERSLSKERGRYLCGREPLRSFHFSQFDPESLALGPLDERPTGVLRELCEDYAGRLFDMGYRETRYAPYPFAATASGMPIDARMRRVVRRALLAGAPDVPDPFEFDGAHRFLEWLRAPSPANPGVSRYIADVYETRPDLRARFPQSEASESVMRGFLRWIHERGAAEELIPPELTPPFDRDGSDHVDAGHRRYSARFRAVSDAIRRRRR